MRDYIAKWVIKTENFLKHIKLYSCKGWDHGRGKAEGRETHYPHFDNLLTHTRHCQQTFLYLSAGLKGNLTPP